MQQPLIQVYCPPTFDLKTQLQDALGFLQEEGYVIFSNVVEPGLQQGYIKEVEEWIPR